MFCIYLFYLLFNLVLNIFASIVSISIVKALHFCISAQRGSNQLLDADVLLISHNTCASDQVYGKFIDTGMFCAGHMEGGVDSCQVRYSVMAV